jgi:hypothetical protein
MLSHFKSPRKDFSSKNQPFRHALGDCLKGGVTAQDTLPGKFGNLFGKLHERVIDVYVLTC